MRRRKNSEVKGTIQQGHEMNTKMLLKISVFAYAKNEFIFVELGKYKFRTPKNYDKMLTQIYYNYGTSIRKRSE